MYKIKYLQSGWYGGKGKVIGECSCGEDFVWDDDDLECVKAGIGAGMVVLIIFLVIAALIICCCVFKVFC